MSASVALAIAWLGWFLAERVVARFRAKRPNQMLAQGRPPLVGLDVIVGELLSRLRGGANLDGALVAMAGDPLTQQEVRLWAHWVQSRSQDSSVESALVHWAQAQDESEATRFAQLCVLVRSTGASLVGALEDLAMRLRSQRAHGEELAALVAPARLSGRVLSLLPVGFLAVTAVMSPEIVHVLMSPGGVLLLIVGASLNALGWLWISRLLGRP